MLYTDQRFTGERALFNISDAQINSCIFADGESPLKEGSNLTVDKTSFQWKYPLWYCNDVVVNDSSFFEMARAGVWYTNNASFTDVLYGAPKGFRRCDNLTLTNVSIPQAQETLWHCSNVTLTNVSACGDYFGMDSENVVLKNFTLRGNYSFDGVKHITAENCKFICKDAFWNCDDVVIKDSYICGEYIGWNSKNLTFINCTIESEQGFCYIENLKLVNCKVMNTNLAFEYVKNVDATITTDVISVKNPISGTIKARSIGEIIFDDADIDKNATDIVTQE